MKLQDNTNTIIRSGSFEESNYTIEASAKAFSILSDGLYANKIEAVIRELSTNAYDAHVDAGYPEKHFDVHFPNRFEPSFSIRDYGTGLSHEDCMSLYTTYFGSNKTNSNDAVGCLGLGSKSPFAYTDSFIVTSYFNGKKRVYNSYKNERDEPVFALLNEEDSNAPVGMEISFAVEQEDINEFEESAQSVYKFFKTLPMLVNGSSTELFVIEEEVEYIIEGSNWGLVKQPASDGRSHYGRRHSTYNASAIMGQIAYPIDSSQFDDEDVKALLDSEAHIHFNIGELDITPSREALSYNEYTKRAIKETIECILLEMKEVIEESFDECKTLHEARMKYYKLKDSGNMLNRIVGIFDTADVTWLDTPLWSGDMKGLPRVEIPESISVRCIFRDDWKVSILSENTSRIRFDHSKDMHFIYDDLKRGGIGRAKHFIKGKVGEDKYADKNNDMGYLFTGGATKDEVIDALQCDDSDLILTSTLPSPTQSNTSYRSGLVRSKVAIWESNHWKDAEVDLSKGGVYVEINRYKTINPNGDEVYKSPSSIVAEMIAIGYDFGEEEVVVYGIKSQELKKKKFNNNNNWANLFEEAEKAYNSVVGDMLEWREDYNYFSKTENHYTDLLNLTLKMDKVPELMSTYLKECEKNNERKNFVLSFDSISKMTGRDTYCYHELNRETIHGSDLAATEEANPWPAKWNAVISDYPMVEHLLEEISSWNMEDKHVDAMIDYINMVERCKNIDNLLE